MAGGLPSTIDGIIRHMDRLEPGKRYFERQKDSRDGCSKTRKKLRDFANKRPDHPGVRFWVASNSWAPPDVASLEAVMSLLKTMI